MPKNPPKTKSRQQLEKSWARKNNALAVKEGAQAALGIAATVATIAAVYPSAKEGVKDFMADYKIKRSRSKERRETVHNITNIR